jgi:hypothetical protein
VIFHILKKSIVAKGYKFSLYALTFVGVSNIIQFFIYLRADSTAIGLLQSLYFIIIIYIYKSNQCTVLKYRVKS